MPRHTRVRVCVYVCVHVLRSRFHILGMLLVMGSNWWCNANPVFLYLAQNVHITPHFLIKLCKITLNHQNHLQDPD